MAGWCHAKSSHADWAHRPLRNLAKRDLIADVGVNDDGARLWALTSVGEEYLLLDRIQERILKDG